MIDILGVSQAGDLEIFSTQLPLAKNILSTQIGKLEYLPFFGIDLKFFLQTDLKFQNESFQSYLIQQLSGSGINLASLDVSISELFSQYNFNLAPVDDSTALLTR